MDAPAKLSRIRATVVIGFVLAIFYHYIRAYYGRSQDYTVTTFLCLPFEHFGDFLNLQASLAGWDPYRYEGSVYFPFSFVSMAPFLLIPGRFGVYLYLAVFAAALGRHCYLSLKR